MATGNILHSLLLSKDQRVESLIKKLEETCEQVRGDKSIAEMAKDEGDSVYIPMRVREIVQEVLGSNSWEQTCLASTLSQENSKLLKELDKAQALLSDSRKDSHDLGLKYITVAEKVKHVDEQEEQLAEMQLEREHLLQEVAHLKKMVDDWEKRHQLYIRAYQDGHNQQEVELKQLHAKLEDYQVKCVEMAEKLEEAEGDTVKINDSNLLVAALETKMKRLEKELDEISLREEVESNSDTTTYALQQRVVELSASNQRLCDQLHESQDTNQRLAEDVHELLYRWGESQAKLEEKECVWQQKMASTARKSLENHKTSLVNSLQEVENVKNQLTTATATIKRELAVSQDECKLFSKQITSRVGTETSELRNTNQILMLELQQKEQDLAKTTADLESLSVKHEALQMQIKLTMSSYEQQLGSLDCRLKESKVSCEERVHIIDDLESSKAEMEHGKSNAEKELSVIQMDKTQLINDLDTLKSCVNAIMDMFSLPEDELPDPTHQHRQRFPMQPKAYETAEDMKRLKDWAISVVKCSLNCRDEVIEEMNTEIVTLKDSLDSREERTVELEEEAKAHSATSKMIKAELDSCNDEIREITGAKNKLEKHLEKVALGKMESEHELSQAIACQQTLELEKDKLTSNNFSLRDSVSKMKYDMEKLKEEKQSQDLQLTIKQNNTKKLEMQLRSNEGEANNLRHRITELEVDKQNLEQDISKKNISLASFQVEKDSLLAELKAVRESEASEVATLEELKNINRSLEANKRHLTKTLKEITDKKIKLDKENARLEEDKVECEDELQLMKGKSTKLSEEVSHLNTNFDKAETLLREVQNDREQLSIEAAARSEALGTVKHTLAEVQIQRGKLNNIIAKMTQEKGDFIREKVSSSAEIAKLSESIKVAEERATSLAGVNQRLVKNLEELKLKSTEVESTIADLQKTIFSLQQEKHIILTETDRIVREKDEETSHRMNLKNVELQNALMGTKAVESELKADIQQEKMAAERKIIEVIAVHKNEMKLQVEHQQEMVAHLEHEIESLSKSSKVESSRLVKQKELAAHQFEEEKGELCKRLEKLQKLFEEKCNEARGQYEQSNHLLAKQRSQLETSNVNAQRLESELSIAEQHLQNLQNKLDEVNCVATVQVESFQSKLKNASQKISQLESLHNDSLITITKLEGQRDTLQRNRNGTQNKFESVMNEKAELQDTCDKFRQNLVLMEKELSKINEMVRYLQVKLKKTEDARTVNESDASLAHKSLTNVENLHAQLVSDHAALQATLTSCEQQKTTFQLDLRSAQGKVTHLEKQKEDSTNNVGVLENRLTFATKLGELREKEISNFRQRVINLEREKNELSMNLTKVQETLRMQGKMDAATKSELQSQVSDLRSLRDSLKGEISSLKMVINVTKHKVSDTDSRLTATCGQASSLALELKDSTTELKYLHSKYMELIGVLSGTLGIALQQDDSSSLDATQTPKQISYYISQTESGIGESLGLSLHSSLSSSRQEMDRLSICICSDSVRDAILNLQKNLICAEKLKLQALSSASNLEKSVNQLEKEKLFLEDHLHTLNSSLIALQEKFAHVSRERTNAETVAKTHQRNSDALEKTKQQLQFDIVCLHQQMDIHGSAKTEAEYRVKKLTTAQKGSKMDTKHLQMQAIEMELQTKQKDETISKQKVIITMLQSSQETKEAEILHLQEKLVSSQHACWETENQLKSMRECIQHIDSSKKASQERECKLTEKIRELEDELTSAQSKKISLDRKVSDLNREVGAMKKEHCVQESKLHALSQNQIESDTEKEKLQNKIKKLKGNISDDSVNHRLVSSRIQSMEVQLKQKEYRNEEMDIKIVLLVQEKEELFYHLKQVEEDLQEAIKGKQIANDLCSSLETEKNLLQHELCMIREENLRLRGELREANYQSHRLDVLVSTHQKQKSELDSSLIATSKRNLELMKSLREERTSAVEHDMESNEKLEGLSLEVGQLKMSETQWEGREKSYKKMINKLESKIKHMEKRKNESKLKKIQFIQKVQEKERRSIPNLHVPFQLSGLGGQELYLSATSPIHTTLPSRDKSFSSSRQMSGHSPAAEGRGMSSCCEINYPITSTPTSSSSV